MFEVLQDTRLNKHLFYVSTLTTFSSYTHQKISTVYQGSQYLGCMYFKEYRRLLIFNFQEIFRFQNFYPLQSSKFAGLEVMMKPL